MIKDNINPLTPPAVEMRSRQEEIDHVTQEAERRDKELMELQTKLQETEKILVHTYIYIGREMKIIHRDQSIFCAFH